MPAALIAEYPSADRTQSRLLHLPASPAQATDLRFSQLLHLLRPNDLIVLNDSKVVRARLSGSKRSGGKVEIMIERILDDRRASAQLGAGRVPIAGTLIRVGKTCLQVSSRCGRLFELCIKSPAVMTFTRLLDNHGKVPLPPYIRRPARELDRERYQTVYAKYPGSVAAPTAGLHFDRALLEECRRHGAQVQTLTLHIGLGTFQPIGRSNLDEHVMHQEVFALSQELCDAVHECRARGGRVIAVGSTVVRALETVAQMNEGRLRAFRGTTGIFIRPGYLFRVADSMITNFHLPQSTLFILVCAFAGRKRVIDAYRHAIAQRYRFYSYGDAMWIDRNDAVQD